MVKTASKAKAVLIVRYHNNKRIIMKHIGSAHTSEVLNDLMILAEEWIRDYTGQLSIIPDENPNRLLYFSHSIFIGVNYHFFYQQMQIRAIQKMIKLVDWPSLINDLVVTRIFEPASKLRSLELILNWSMVRSPTRKILHISMFLFRVLCLLYFLSSDQPPEGFAL